MINSTMYIYAHRDQFANHQQRNELLGYPTQKCLGNGVVEDALHFAIASGIEIYRVYYRNLKSSLRNVIEK